MDIIKKIRENQAKAEELIFKLRLMIMEIDKEAYENRVTKERFTRGR
jgi:hypothetical protein